MVEEKVSAKSSSKKDRRDPRSQASPVAIDDIQATNEKRIKMPSGELNRVLGGGLVQGSIVLLGGEPVLANLHSYFKIFSQLNLRQFFTSLAKRGSTQIKMRADRIGRGSKNCFILSETSLDAVFDQLEATTPASSLSTQFKPL